MAKNINKIFKSGNRFEFKNVNYSSSEVQEELRKLGEYKRKLEEDGEVSMYDLQRITLN